VICLLTPAEFGAVSRWYTEFPQLTDREVELALARVSVPSR
jgi:predicted phosphoribosyltransferase